MLARPRGPVLRAALRGPFDAPAFRRLFAADTVWGVAAGVRRGRRGLGGLYQSARWRSHRIRYWCFAEWSGHLAHMPSHVYWRVGEYHAAA